MPTQTFVIVGAGLAAGKAAEALRDGGHQGRILVFGQEPHRPYERPPLSKGFLMGSDPPESAFVHSPDWYDEHDVELRLGTEVTAIDPGAKSVIADGQARPYDKLLLTTGARPRRLAMADDSQAPVAYLRTIEDSERIKAALVPGAAVTIIGGGWIGLEVAAAARNAGTEVTVVEQLELPLLPVLGPKVAAIFAELHRDKGVDLRVSTAVSAITADDGGAMVDLGDGTSIRADLVVVGIGVIPNASLAAAAGLETDNGILVDRQLRTSDPDIYAAGDVANADHPLLGRRIRVEHWDNAIGQGVLAGRNMAGDGGEYNRLPYFFTDQYDLGMEYVGSIGPDGYDEVVLREGAGERVFTAFWLRHGRVLAAMHANDWDAIEPIRTIVGADHVDEALRDTGTPLEQIAATCR